MQGGREAAYSTGNKVYGMGRPNATSGPVDPAGYVERSNNIKNSDRRSGLAAAALRRLGGSPNQQQPQEQAPEQEAPQPIGIITLPDGRRVAPNATGQYTWL